MPQPRKRQRPGSTRNQNRSAGAPNAEITPEEIASIRSSITAKEQAPSGRQQAGSKVDWAKVRNRLGDPYDVENIPLDRLKLMRRDPMISFGTSFVKTPLARGKWIIKAHDNNGPNAQVSANVDWAWRRVMASYVFSFMNILDFGFQAMSKRYELRTPSGTYIEPGDPGSGGSSRGATGGTPAAGDTTDPQGGPLGTEQPLWSEGSIQPVCWKPFVALDPANVEPIWTPQGEFGGIKYSAGSGGAPAGASAGSEPGEFNIDIYHALWATHEKEQNFGSIFGYPRIGYAAAYWWSYWFRWAMADRAFEKRADPATIVKHPDGSFVDDETGVETSYQSYAEMIGEMLRSGATVTLPSDVYMGEMDGKPSTVPLWDIEFTKDAVDFEPFDKSFEYLDKQKLRSLWIPEQALVEGSGGTSSRNVASEMNDILTESQNVLANQLVDSINRWILPQFIATNFPEFVANGGEAVLEMQGFGEGSSAANEAILQFIGQQESGAKELLSLVDLEKILEKEGIPILSFRQQQAKAQQIVEEEQAAEPPAVEPVAGQSVGVVPNSLGFNSYIQPREVIYLSDSSNAYLDKLPATKHYEDPEVRKASRQLWDQWSGLYKDDYESFADFLEGLGGEIQMAETGRDTRAAVRRIVKKWQGNLDRLGKVLESTQGVYGKIMKRARDIEIKKAKLKEGFDDDQMNTWINNHSAEFVTRVQYTTREELAGFLAKRIEEGVTDTKVLADEVREHFSGDFPQWKADRLARTETRDAYNAASLMTAMSNGAKVEAIDGTDDEECRERNGTVFDPMDAVKERDHPNGTLAWKILPVAAAYTISEDLPEGLTAFYDEDNEMVVFHPSVTDEERKHYMSALNEIVGFSDDE